MGAQPVGGEYGQPVERVTHGLSHQFEAIDAADSGQHVGGVGTLPAACAEQTPLLQEGEQVLEQLLFSAGLAQAVAIVTQHGMTEARVLEFQTEQELPVNATRHGLGGGGDR